MSDKKSAESIVLKDIVPSLGKARIRLIRDWNINFDNYGVVTNVYVRRAWCRS